uniref:Uncharacterized protein n=1 Tax=Arundo donax TaxID=35708 RepID=A0A0A8Y961_ARUDO
MDSNPVFKVELCKSLQDFYCFMRISSEILSLKNSRSNRRSSGTEEEQEDHDCEELGGQIHSSLLEGQRIVVDEEIDDTFLYTCRLWHTDVFGLFPEHTDF